MVSPSLKQFALLFLAILCSILVARMVSGLVLSMLGLSGIAAFLAGFVLYAAIFFGILALSERLSGIRVFGLV